MNRHFVTAALMFTLCTAAVHAGPRQANVSLAGLDLTKPADVQVMDRRIHDAAVEVCGTAQYKPGQGITQFIEDQETVAGCVAQAEAGARLKLTARANPAPSTQLAASGN